MLRDNSILSHLRAGYGFPSCRSAGFSYLEQYAFENLLFVFATEVVHQTLNTGRGRQDLFTVQVDTCSFWSLPLDLFYLLVRIFHLQS